MKRISKKQKVVVFLFKYCIAFGIVLALTYIPAFADAYERALARSQHLTVYLMTMAPFFVAILLKYILMLIKSEVYDDILSTWNPDDLLSSHIQKMVKAIKELKKDALEKNLTIPAKQIQQYTNDYLNKHKDFFEEIYKRDKYKYINSSDNIYKLIERVSNGEMTNIF